MRRLKAIGAALMMVVGSAVAVFGIASPASAAGDCYTAVTRSFSIYLEAASSTQIGPYYGSTHCNDVNIRKTGSTGYYACVVRTYQGQTDCAATTYVPTTWVVPNGGYGIPNGAAFKVKLQASPYRTLNGVIAY